MASARITAASGLLGQTRREGVEARTLGQAEGMPVYARSRTDFKSDFGSNDRKRRLQRDSQNADQSGIQNRCCGGTARSTENDRCADALPHLSVTLRSFR